MTRKNNKNNPDRIKKMEFLIEQICIFSLNRAGFSEKGYRFFLKMAMQRQKIINSTSWGELANQFSVHQSQNHLKLLQKNKLIKNNIQLIVQSIVNDVAGASKEHWALKLLKTRYLSHLCRARDSSLQAMELFSKKDSECPESQLWVTALNAYQLYLESLIKLPFILERFLASLTADSVIEYQSAKSVELLTDILDIVRKNSNQKIIISALKFTVKIKMPHLDVADNQLVKMIHSELLPFINTLLNCSSDLEKAKKAIQLDRNSEEITKARLALLEVVDVRFESLQEIMTSTLIQPISECNRVVSEVSQLGNSLAETTASNNMIDRLKAIHQAFTNLDTLNLLYDKLEERDRKRFPNWLNKAHDVYNNMKKSSKKSAALSDTLFDSLGLFYHYATTLIPEAVCYYFKRSTDLQNVLNTIDTKPNLFNIKTIQVYFSFYQLVEQSAIKEPLRKLFFEAYVDAAAKDNPQFDKKDCNYQQYKDIAYHISTKLHLNLDRSLKEQIETYGQQEMTRSLLGTFEQQRISNMKKMNVIMMIHRLQELEHYFDAKHPDTVFSELNEAINTIVGTREEALQQFNQRFLKDTAKRIWNRYQKDRLIPLVEEAIDSAHMKYKANKHLYNGIYSKLKEEIFLTEKDRTIIACLLEAKESHNTIRLANHIYQNPYEWEINAAKEHKTPKQKQKENIKVVIKTLIPTMTSVLDLIQNHLSNQEHSCIRLLGITKNQNILDLAEAKINYIRSLNTLFHNFRSALQTPSSKLHQFLEDSLTGEIKQLTTEQIIHRLSLKKIPGQLIRFVWHVLPDGNDKTGAVNQNLLNNMMHYYFTGSLSDVVKAQQNYYHMLNEKPVPILMKDLNDPLSRSPFISVEEKMLDAVLGRLFQRVSKTTLSLGLDYIQKTVSVMTRETIAPFIPYPYMGDLVLQLLNSKTFISTLNTFYNAFIHDYRGTIRKGKDVLAAEAKKRLYPILGIEVQNHLEERAYRFAQHPQTAQTADCDIFAIFFLQYHELSKNSSEKENKEKLIDYLFSNLLKNKNPKHRTQIQQTFIKQFALFSSQISFDSLVTHKAGNLTDLQNQLNLLIQNLDFKDSENTIALKLVLFNRIINIGLDSARDLQNQDELHVMAIKKLSQVLSKISQHPEVKSSHYQEILSPSKERVMQLQINRLNKKLEQVGNTASIIVTKNKKQQRENQKYLDKSVAQKNWGQSNKIRKAAILSSYIYEVISLVAVWTAIIAPATSGAGMAQSLYIALGLSTAVGATATGIGIAVIAFTTLGRFAVLLGQEVLSRKGEYKTVKDKPLGKRLSAASFLTIKSMGMAAVKTIFTTFLLAKIMKLFAYQTVSTLIQETQKTYPGSERLKEENELLNSIKKQTTEVKRLINALKESQSSTVYKTLLDKIEGLEIQIEDVENKIFKIPFPNDAREVGYFTSLQNQLPLLKKDLVRLKLYLCSERKMMEKTDEATLEKVDTKLTEHQNSTLIKKPQENKAEKNHVIVRIEDYINEQKKKYSLWNENKLTKANEVKDKNTLNESSFEDLVKSMDC